MQQETDTHASGLPDSAPESITLKDVLRAVFMPPSEMDRGPMPEVVPSQMLNRARLQISDAPTPDILAIGQESTIVYEHSPRPVVADASTTRIVVLGFGVVAAVLLTYLAQVALAGSEESVTAPILYGFAAVAWIALLALEFAPPDGGLLLRGPRAVTVSTSKPTAAWLTRSSLVTRSLLAIMALSLSGATYVFTADNTFTLPGVLTWIGSVIGWLLVVARREPEELIADFISHVRSLRLSEPSHLFNRRSAIVIVISLAILVAAVFFRFYRIGEIPGEMTSDHVEKLLDAYDVSQGQFHVYFPRNGGREAIQMYLVALASRLFGTGMSFLTLKLVSALEALALVPLIVWLGRELVDWETGLLAAALLAISWWDTSLARLGLRIVLTPLVFTCVLIAMLRSIRTRTRKAWVWVGIWLGVGVYSYQALRMAPLVVVAGFVIAVAGPVIRAVRGASSDGTGAVRRIVATNIVGTQAANLAACSIVALAVFVPMLRFWHDDPGALWNRVVNRTTSSEVAIQGSPFDVLVSNYRNALGMYNIRGDGAWIDSVPGAPTLDLVTGGLLVLGLIAWLMRLRVRRDAGDVFLIVAGLIMLLPSALAIAFPIENPSVTRASGTLPVVMVLAAWPLALTRQRWSAVMRTRSGSLLASGLAVVLLAGAAVLNYQTFFEKFPASYRLSALNPGQVAREVRKVIGSDGSLDGVWLIGWPYWHDYRAIGIEAGDITFQNAILDSTQLQSDLQTVPDRFNARPLVFIIAEQDVNSRASLEAQFPQGYLEHHIGVSEKHNFYLFIVSQ